MSPEKQRLTFLSYSRINKDFALKLAKELKADGFLVWLDQLDIPTGARWDDELEKALDASDIFMVILTPASISSDNVKDEIGFAIDNGKRILPILLKDAKVPLRLRRFQYVDFTTKSFDEGIDSAKQLLSNLINESTIPREDIPVGSQDKGSQAKAQESKEKDEEQLAGAKVDTDDKAKKDAERIARQKTKSDQIKTETENVIKASSLLAEGKRLLQNQEWPVAAEIFRRVLSLTPNHAETKKLLSDAEAQILQERESADRKAKEEAERLAKQKAEDEKAAYAKAEAERLAKQEAERLKAQKAEMDRKAKEASAPAVALSPVNTDTPAQPSKKKSLSKPLKIGIGVGVALVLVVCAVLGVGMLVGPTDPPIGDPPVVADPPTADSPIVADPPTAVIPITGDDPACPFDDSQLVDVHVENLSGYNLDYYWIDYDCEPQYWGTLNAGEAMMLGTYISHIWEFYDNQTGDYYFGYEADGGDYLAIQGDGSAPVSNSFLESFDDNSNEWYTGSDNTGYKSIEDGYYVWDVQLNGGTDAWQFLNTDISVSDFDFRVDAKRIGGTSSELCYGIIFRATEKDISGIVSSGVGKHYELEVCDDQYYLISYFDGNDWNDWVDWPQDSGINTNDWNTLEVRVTGNQLEYFINDTKVAEFSDSNLDSGNVGLSVYSYDDTQGQIIFDNFYLNIK